YPFLQRSHSRVVMEKLDWGSVRPRTSSHWGKKSRTPPNDTSSPVPGTSTLTAPLGSPQGSPLRGDLAKKTLEHSRGASVAWDPGVGQKWERLKGIHTELPLPQGVGVSLVAPTAAAATLREVSSPLKEASSSPTASSLCPTAPRVGGRRASMSRGGGPALLGGMAARSPLVPRREGGGAVHWSP
ncbi:unnamed protein product, partial [Discosporangium mesarthrocarpum]